MTMNAVQAKVNIESQPQLLYNTEQAAALLGLNVKTLRQYRQEGRGPNYMRVANSKRARAFYKYEDLVAWVDELYAKRGK